MRENVIISTKKCAHEYPNTPARIHRETTTGNAIILWESSMVTQMYSDGLHANCNSSTFAHTITIMCKNFRGYDEKLLVIWNDFKIS